MEYTPGRESQRNSALTAIGLRLVALKQRFPSASQGLLSIFDQALVSGTSFVSAAIIGRTTAPDDLGLYYLVLSIVTIVSAIQDNAISAPYLVYCRQRQGRELDEYSGSVWVYYLILSLMTALTLLVVVPIVSLSSASSISPGLWALLVALPLVLLRQAIRRFAFARLHVRSAVALDAVVAVVQLGGLALIGYLGQMSLVGIFVIMGGACGLASFGAFLLDKPRVHFVRERLLSDWRCNWAFGKWTLRSYLLGYTTPFVLLWILGLSVGAAAAGVLGACTTLVGMTNVLIMGVDNVLTPQASHAFATGGTRDLRRILARTAAFLVLTLGGFSLLILATGDRLAVLAFGAAGQGSGAILAALAVSTLMNGIGVVAGNGLWAIDKPRPNFLADVFCMFATIVAAWFLIVPLGVLGAALANLAGMSAAAIVRTITLMRYLHRTQIDHAAAASNPDACLNLEVLSSVTPHLPESTCC